MSFTKALGWFLVVCIVLGAAFLFTSFQVGPVKKMRGILLLEYESLQAYDEFQEKLVKREDYQGFQSAWSQVILPHTLRSSLLSDRARGIWFNGQGTNVESD